MTAMMLPLRTAREIPPFGSKGDPVETRWRNGCFILEALLQNRLNDNVLTDVGSACESAGAR